MDAGSLSLDFNTLFLVAVAVAIFWSLRTLFVYFLGGNDPLMKNTEARLEANRKPEELIPVAKAHEAEKRFRAIIVLIIVMWLLYYVDSEAFLQLFGSVGQAIVEFAQMLAQVVRQGASQVLQ